MSVNLKYIVSTFILLQLHFILSSAQNITFQSCFGGTMDDDAFAVSPTHDGRFVFCGMVESFDGDINCNQGGKDGWLVKLDLLGNIIWSRCFGGSNNDVLNSVSLCNDGGFILGGSTYSFDGNASCDSNLFNKLWVIKTDSLGAIIWQQCIGNTSGNRILKRIIQTSDGGYLVGAENDDGSDVNNFHGGTDFWMLKLDSIGNIQWSEAFGGFSHEILYDVIEITSQLYIACGTAIFDGGMVSGTHGGMATDGWLIGVDSSGSFLWQTCLGGSLADGAYKLAKTFDGNIMIAATASSTDGDVSMNFGSRDVWVVKMNTSGSILWEKSYGGSGGDLSYSITQSGNGFTILAGSSSNDGDVSGHHNLGDYWVLEIDSAGNLIKESCFGGSGVEFAKDIVKVGTSHFVAIGDSYSIDGDVSGYHADSLCDPFLCMDMWVVVISDLQNVVNESLLQNTKLKVTFNANTFELIIHYSEQKHSEFILEVFDVYGRSLYNERLFLSNGIFRYPLTRFANIPTNSFVRISNNSNIAVENLIKF